jgi:ferredoxin
VKIIADHGTCEGLGMCEAMAHDFFQVGEAGLVDVLNEAPAEQDRALVQAAVEACPVGALRLQN